MAWKGNNRTFRARGPSSAVTLKYYRVTHLIATALGDVMTDVDGLGG